MNDPPMKRILLLLVCCLMSLVSCRGPALRQMIKRLPVKELSKARPKTAPKPNPKMTKKSSSEENKVLLDMLEEIVEDVFLDDSTYLFPQKYDPAHFGIIDRPYYQSTSTNPFNLKAVDVTMPSSPSLNTSYQKKSSSPLSAPRITLPAKPSGYEY